MKLEKTLTSAHCEGELSRKYAKIDPCSHRLTGFDIPLQGPPYEVLSTQPFNFQKVRPPEQSLFLQLWLNIQSSKANYTRAITVTM